LNYSPLLHHLSTGWIFGGSGQRSGFPAGTPEWIDEPEIRRFGPHFVPGIPWLESLPNKFPDGNPKLRPLFPKHHLTPPSPPLVAEREKDSRLAI
jgi:hypothetical protein